MDALKSLLGNWMNTTGSSALEVPRDELCERCGVLLELTDDGFLRRHECCVCRDYGWYVRAPSKRNEPGAPYYGPGSPGFGQRIPCDHRGASMKPAAPVFDPVRQGVPYRLGGARIDLAGTGSGAKEAREWLASWPPAMPILTFLGEPGRGKSWLGSAVLRAAFERHGVQGWYVDYPALMGRFRQTQAEDAQERSEDLIEMLLRMPFLVLDDVGKGNQTKFTSECLYRVLGGRESAMSPTLCTANIPEFSALEPSLKSRLVGGLVVQFEGPDRRPQQAAKESVA